MTARTLVATGVSGGLGLEAIKQLLEKPNQSWRMLLGVRNPDKTGPEIEAINPNKSNQLSFYKVDYSDLRQVKSFGHSVLKDLGGEKLDWLLLNHGMSDGASEKGQNGSKWCEAQVVNHDSHHYLMHLLKDKISESHTRVVFVSSGAIRRITDISRLKKDLLAGSDAKYMDVYSGSKFTHLLAAHHWRRQLGDEATVVAVSPGMVPGTDIFRHTGISQDLSTHADAKDVPTGARSILAAFTRDDIPSDPNAIFLTSWGEWWDPNEIYPLTLDKKLQDEWCPSKEEMEKEVGI